MKSGNLETKRKGKRHNKRETDRETEPKPIIEDSTSTRKETKRTR